MKMGYFGLSVEACYSTPIKPLKGIHSTVVGGNLHYPRKEQMCGAWWLPTEGREAAVHRLDMANCMTCCLSGAGSQAVMERGCNPLPHCLLPTSADSCGRESLGLPEEIRNGSLAKPKALKGDWGLGGRGTVSSLFLLSKVIILARKGGCGEIPLILLKVRLWLTMPDDEPLARSGTHCSKTGTAMFAGRVTHLFKRY